MNNNDKTMIDEWLSNNEPTIIQPSQQALQINNHNTPNINGKKQYHKPSKEITDKFKNYFNNVTYKNEKEEVTLRDFDGNIDDLFDYYEAKKIKFKLFL